MVASFASLGNHMGFSLNFKSGLDLPASSPIFLFSCALLCVLNYM